MSAPVSIPTRRGGGARASSSGASGPRSAMSCSSSSSAAASPPSASSSYTYSASSSSNTPANPSPLRMASSPSTDGPTPDRGHRRGSLMSSTLAASEHTVINIGGPDGPPRLITCVRSSQGFDWNQEIFLPSHYDHLISQDLERKRDPVHDIVLTDDEVYGILPQ